MSVLGRGLTAGLAVALSLTLGGCSGSEGPPPAAGDDGAVNGTASPSADGYDFAADPAKLPRDAAGARALAAVIAPDPAALGDGFVAATPYESDPGTWAVLDDACAWQREPLPDGVLSSLSRYAEAPGADGEPPVRVTLVVTVHASVESADREVTTTLEEALRCPDQQLGRGEYVTGLSSFGSAAGVRGQNSADDHVVETGQYTSDADGGPHPYTWAVDRIGSVIVGVSVRGPADEALATDALAGMRSRVEEALG
ncbi:hypothetical protein D7318_04060 [Streptomyces radicis]|uniref:Sensor domain-containing protein n=2 Tax=Streptomyces radicis TaxID=1750517 RepID=A0ABX9RS57_9ACTN|nr:hypothetical protein D7318_04060 [Streptomyces radicis]